MSAVQSAIVECYTAEGKPDLPLDRGRFVGGPVVWDELQRGFRDYLTRAPLADEMSLEEQVEYARLSGLAYDEAFKAVTLAWQIVPQDISQEWWMGMGEDVFGNPAVRPWPSDPAGGMWRLVRPDGNPSVLLLQQYNGAADLSWELTSQGLLEADPYFCISMYREASISNEEAAAMAALPYLWAGFGFGGCWHVRFPKWREAELYRRVSGEWQLVSRKAWQQADTYKDKAGEREVFITVQCAEGMIVLRSDVAGEPWTYVPDRPTTVAAAPVSLAGNGGAACFGLHGLEYARTPHNVLIARQRTELDTTPGTLPVQWAVGAKPKGTSAEAVMYDAAGHELTAPAKTFTLGLRLQSSDGKRSPLVRLSGVEVLPTTQQMTPAWLDISGDFIEADGGWTLDVDERCMTQNYTVKVNNRHGRYNGWHGNRMVALHVGRPGSEAAGHGLSWADGRPARRFTSLAEVVDITRESFSQQTATLQTIDGLEELDQVEIGPRPPLDGLTVAEAKRRVLSWGHVSPGRIGDIYDSGNRLPTSSYGVEQQLGEASSEISGALDLESGGACQLRPELSVKRALRWLSNFDYNTFDYFGETGLFFYDKPTTEIMRRFRVTDSPVAEDEIRKGLSFRPRLREGQSSVTVSGRERTSGRPLASRVTDTDALNRPTSRRFRGYDANKRVEDNNLTEQRLVNLRCRWEYQWLLRLRDATSFSALGQRLLPSWPIAVGATNWIILNVRERIERGGKWTTEIDAVSA